MVYDCVLGFKTHHRNTTSTTCDVIPLSLVVLEPVAQRPRFGVYACDFIPSERDFERSDYDFHHDFDVFYSSFNPSCPNFSVGL